MAQETTVLTSLVVVPGVVDTGAGSDSVILGALGDSITLTGVLTSTSINGGAGADSIVVQANMASASIESGAGNDTQFHG